MQALPNDNQIVLLPADNQALDFSEVSEVQDTVSGAINEVQAGSSRVRPQGKSSKNKAPVSVSSVRRSSRSNKYDGFKVPALTDRRTILPR